MAKKLTQEQKAQIYCVKNGHANYVTLCFGYVHCGRCNEQIGDRLGGVFDTSNIIVVGCPDKPCKHCDPIQRKLSKLDKEILKRLKKDHKKGEFSSYEEILKGIDFRKTKQDVKGGNQE